MIVSPIPARGEFPFEGLTIAKSDWRTVSGFPEYAVSRTGEVRSQYIGRDLTPSLIKGYLRVRLHSGGNRRAVSIHVLVAEAFHGPRPTDHECAHLDGNPLNNAAENLAWVTRTENEAHKRHHGTATIGERSPHAKLTNEQAELVREAARRPLRRCEIATLAGVTESVVDGILMGRTYPKALTGLRHPVSVTDAGRQ